MGPAFRGRGAIGLTRKSADPARNVRHINFASNGANRFNFPNSFRRTARA